MPKQQPTKTIKGQLCHSTSFITDLLEIDRSTLSRWKNDGCPQIALGWWDLKEVLKWKGLISGSGIKTPEEIERLSLNEQKLKSEVKYKQAQSEAFELKNAIAKGEYIPKQEIVTELQRFFTILKRSMQGYSRKVAAELAHLVSQSEARRIERLINDVTMNALEQISINGVYQAKKAGKFKI